LQLLWLWLLLLWLLLLLLLRHLTSIRGPPQASPLGALGSCSHSKA
jgi:hypothetical protein